VPWRGAATFLLFWLVALAVGTALVMVVVGGSFGRLLIVAAPGLVLLLLVSFRGRCEP
jgi:hypothetical protein